MIEFLGAARCSDCVHGRTVARVRVLPRDRGGGGIRVDHEVEERREEGGWLRPTETAHTYTRRAGVLDVAIYALLCL